MKLEGKVALITGGARGIGKEIAFLFLKEGAKVAIFDINDEDLKITEDEAKSKGYELLSLKADVTNVEDIKKGIDIILDRYKKIDILVNNAGITCDKVFLRMTESDWDKVLNVNLKAAFLVSREVLKSMIKQKYGKIINISSIIGLVGNPGQANYSASKAGLLGLTKTLAKEFASRNIMVNAICPGFIQTQMTEKLPQEVKEKMFSQIPLKRFGTPQDIAKACLFLASSDSDYITGQEIIVDGGLTL